VTVDPLVLIAEVDRATARLIATARTLDAAALAAPSLLPGWTRGHVLSHVARNAESGVRLLTWARTGVETPQYLNADSREADIAAGAARTPEEHVADLAATAAQFTEAVEAMPPQAWPVTIRWLSGRAGPAAGIVWSRLREVEVHHIDLDAGYGPTDWPAAFTRRVLHEVVSQFARDPQAPSTRLHATDLDQELTIGPATSDLTVSGTGADLAAWLTGRDPGKALTVIPAGPLPSVPFWK
jgi:maleylpyruvate isomerase